MPRTVPFVAFALLALYAGPAAAQSTAWGTNGYISFNALVDVASTTYDTVTDLEINAEQTQVTATHDFGLLPVFDITAGGRIKGNLGIGFAFSYAKRSEDARVTGEIPHPFYFGQPRTLDATTPLDREDIAVHIHGMYLLQVSRPFQISVFGGPTWFRVNQETIKTITFHEEYPYDTVTLDKVTTDKVEASRWGYNAGFDASYFFSRQVGVHGIVRYSIASITLGSSPAQDIGGLQVGAGLRIRY